MDATVSQTYFANFSKLAVVVGSLFFVEGAASPTSARAQPAHMCGDGTTFTVNLPARDGGTDETIELPGGCEIYALLVSGYEGNRDLDQLLFYNFAKFVAEHNGYVHYAWWNNLLAPYMEKPLHDHESHPGDKAALIAFVPDAFIDKAIPNEDFQFQLDAERFFLAIQQHNPDALLVAAGHSMGGGSIARLAANSDVSVDLLAPIDPGGNRSQPQVLVFSENAYNWTRWRATHEFRGWGQIQCKARGPLGFCKRCENVWLDSKPLLGSLVLTCPRLAPILDTGTPLFFDAQKVRRLYHRWQKESQPQQDFDKNELARVFGYPAPRSTSDILGPNYQAAFGQSTMDALPPDPNKTCSIHTRKGVADPRDPSLVCADGDGHGEIVGIRVVCPQEGFLNCRTALLSLAQFKNHKQPLGIRALTPPKDPADSTLECFEQAESWEELGVSWRTALTPAERVARFIEISNPGPWPYEPCNPDLDMVSDDLIQIVEDLLAETSPGLDVTPPTSAGVLSPSANGHGWHRDSVVVMLGAADEPGGSGVKEIEYSLSGAELDDGVGSGNTTQFPIANEGTTDVSFFARDNAGNEEAPSNLLTVRIDRTPPTIDAILQPEPNERGWNRKDVTVSFIAEDLLSGIDIVSEPIMLTAEGANQEVTGAATDLAANEEVAITLISLDKSAPQLTGSADRVPDSNGWYNHPVTVMWACEDTLSGVQSFSTPTGYSGPDSVLASVTGACLDNADNNTSSEFSFSFDATSPAVDITMPTDGASYLLNAAVISEFTCTDSVSGVATCDGTVARGTAIDTATVGGKSFTVSGSDMAGNVASATNDYAVQYAFSGFASPIEAMPTVNTVTAGRTVPVKYAISDANGALVSELKSFVSLESGPMACGTNAVGVMEETSAAGKTGIHSSQQNQFVYNWKTDQAWAGSCRMLQLTLNDGTEHRAVFQFKKRATRRGESHRKR